VYNYRDQRFHKHLNIDIEDDWVWESDKSKLLFSDWHEGEPNNDDEECGNMRWDNSQYKWNDGQCHHLFLYSFEQKPVTVAIIWKENKFQQMVHLFHTQYTSF
jgi:hypothetical protein